jgi:hypothetical protein
MTGNIVMSGAQTVDGRDLSVDGAKLDGIEALADVTDATNVNAAGAAIFSTTPTANITDGTSGQVLTTNGSGGLSFTTVSGGGGISNVVEDTTPQLGGDLQSNGNNIDLADNDKLTAGTSEDLQLYHDGTNSYIDNNTGHLYIRNNVDDDDGGDIYLQAKSGETSIQLLDDAGVYFYYDGSLRMTMVFSTTNSYVPIKLLNNNALQFQEDTVNGSNVLSLASAASLTADRTITLPDADGTVALTSDINTANVTAAGALMDSEVTNLADVKSFDPADYATAAQGTTADSAMQDLVDDTTPQLGGVLDTNGNNIEFPDSTGIEVNRLKFGSPSDDLQIYHDTNHSYVRDTGTGALRLTGSNVQMWNSAVTELMLKAIEDGAVELYYDNVKKLETTADGVTITSTDDGDADSPILVLYRDSASPADVDDLGQIIFRGVNDADENVNYASIFVESVDVSDGTEDGQVKIEVMDGGSLNSHMRIGNDFTTFDSNLLVTSGHVVFFEGSTNDNFETQLTVTDPTADRTITLPDATGTVALTSDIPTVGTIASQAADSVDIDGGAIDGVTLGTNTAITEAQIDDINIDGFTIEATSATLGLLIKANGQSVARIQSSSQGQGGGLYLYQDNPSITFEGPTPDANETTLAVTDPTADRTITLPDATGTVALQNQTINAQTGTTYTTVLSDAAQLVTLNNASAITLTIPPNSSVAYPIGTRIDFIQIGAGQVTVAGGTGVTVNSTPTLKFRAQHSAASCIKIATDTWQLVGDLAES